MSGFGGGGFGSTPAAPFGSSQQPPQQQGFGFGGQQPASTTSNPFGSTAQTPAQPQPFGSTAQTPAQPQPFGSSAPTQPFGATPAPSFSSAPAGSIATPFGGSGNTGGFAGSSTTGFAGAPSASGFASSATNVAATPFGGSSNTASGFGTSGGFGSSTTTAAPAMFGSSSTTTPAPQPFGSSSTTSSFSSQPPSQNPFGSTPAAPAAPFGSSTTTTSGFMGAPASDANNPFATSSAAPASGGLTFGASATNVITSTPSSDMWTQSPNAPMQSSPQRSNVWEVPQPAPPASLQTPHLAATSSWPASTGFGGTTTSATGPFGSAAASTSTGPFGASTSGSRLSTIPESTMGGGTSPTPVLMSGPSDEAPPVSSVPSDDTVSGQHKSQKDHELAALKAKIEEKKRRLEEKARRKKDSRSNSPKASTTPSPTPPSSLNANARAFVPGGAAARSRSPTPPPVMMMSKTQQQTMHLLPAELQQQAEQPGDYASLRVEARDDPQALHTAVSLRGTCPYMCPDEELLRRQRENDIQLLEVPQPDGVLHPRGWTLRDTAVKRFRRSAADYKLDVPEWVRPPEVLERVCSYLEEWVMERDRQGPDPRFSDGGTPPPLDVYQFIWDRTRMVRKDFILQNYVGTGGNCDARAVRCHERIARWHAMCEHQLSHIDQFVTAQSQQNIQELGQTMKTLNQFYDDSLHRSTVEVPDENGNETLRQVTDSFGCSNDKVQGQPPVDYDGTPLANDATSEVLSSRLIGKDVAMTSSHGTAEPEMRGLYILCVLNNDGGMEVLKYAGFLFRERNEVYHTRHVQLALSVYKAKKEANYARFFSLLRSPAMPYLYACIMFKHVETMRKVAFKIMAKTYGGRTKDSNESIYDAYPLRNLVRLLCFEDGEEARAACQHYNITVKPMKVKSSSGEPRIEDIVFWKQTSFRDPVDQEKGVVIPLPPRKMLRTIESKLKGATRLGVCRGQVSGEGSATILPARTAVATTAARPLEDDQGRQQQEESLRAIETERRQQQLQAVAQQKQQEEARRQAKQMEEERAFKEAEEKARREAAELARRKAEQARIEAEERARHEAKEKAEREAKEQAEREARERALKEAELARRREAERARKEAEERARREAFEKAQREAKAKAEREARERALKEAAERARREQIALREAEKRAALEAEERARKAAQRKAQEAAINQIKKELLLRRWIRRYPAHRRAKELSTESIRQMGFQTQSPVIITAPMSTLAPQQPVNIETGKRALCDKASLDVNESLGVVREKKRRRFATSSRILSQDRKESNAFTKKLKSALSPTAFLRSRPSLFRRSGN